METFRDDIIRNAIIPSQSKARQQDIPSGVGPLTRYPCCKLDCALEIYPPCKLFWRDGGPFLFPYHFLVSITLSESSFFFLLFCSFLSWRLKGHLRFQAISLLSAGERITVLMPYHVSPNGSITVPRSSYSGSSYAPSSLYILSSAAILRSLYTISLATFLMKSVRCLKQPIAFWPRVRCISLRKITTSLLEW